MKPNLLHTVQALVAPGKGILAADESFPTIEKRFKAVAVPSTPETRRAYREALFSAPGLSAHISGVILFDETIRQNAADGRPLAALLEAAGIVPGIKVDRGTHALPGFPTETITEGLDGLPDRLAAYARLGARFTKWRAVIAIKDHTPTVGALEANAECLARFAAASQEAFLVPVVEPEVLMDGAHILERHAEVTELALRITFAALARHRVRLEHMLLKPNMVLSGKECPLQAAPGCVAEETLRVLRRAVPAAVPGIMFLSGGQSDVRATENLQALNQAAPSAPWQLSFSFGRALQAPALASWAGDSAKVPAMQQALLHRARCNGAARQGAYSGEMESRAA